MVRVKICGITNLEDALAAVEAGADALGFVIWEKSSRYVPPSRAAEIIAKLPPLVAKVGVFVDGSLDVVRGAMSSCHLDLVQLHGEEVPEYCQSLAPYAIKAFRVDGYQVLDRIASYSPNTCLLDAYIPGTVGGTGSKFNWDIARVAGKRYRVILAGGLTPDNVGQAVSFVRPYAVDVSSGVERSPGRKDRDLVRDFIRAAKGV